MLSMGQGLLSCLSSTKRYVGRKEIGGGREGVRVNCLLFIYLLRVGVWCMQVEIVNIKDRERNGGNRCDFMNLHNCIYTAREELSTPCLFTVDYKGLYDSCYNHVCIALLRNVYRSS